MAPNKTAEDKKLRITCTRNGKTKVQQKTLLALGLKRVGRTVTQTANPAIAGMVKSVSHLVTVEELH